MRGPFCAALLVGFACGPQRPSPPSGNDGTGTTDVGGVVGSEETMSEHACPGGVALGPITLQSRADVQAVSGCTVVEGDLHIDPCVDCREDRSHCDTCTNASALTSLEGLEALQRVTGHLTLGWAPQPLAPPGDVDVHDCRGPTDLRTLAGLEALREVEGDLLIHCAPGLENARLPSLERVGVGRLDESPGDLEVQAQVPVDVELPNLREAGSIRLTGARRQQLGVPALERVERDMILWNTSVASIEELVALREIRGIFRLVNNNRISTLEPVDALEYLGYFSVSGTSEITTMDLGGVARGVSIDTMPALESVIIESSTVTALQVWGNPKLATFEAVHVKELEFLTIVGNDSLTTLAGLSGIERVTKEFRITHNASLCTSVIEEFIAGLELEPPAMPWYSWNADC